MALVVVAGLVPAPVLVTERVLVPVAGPVVLAPGPVVPARVVPVARVAVLVAKCSTVSQAGLVPAFLCASRSAAHLCIARSHAIAHLPGDVIQRRISLLESQP